MKRILLYTLIITNVVLLEGCKSSKKPSATGPTPPGEIDVVLPCSGAEYFTNEKVFRANSLGESLDQVLSRKKALTNARADLASNIQTTVKNVTDNYVNSREFNNKEEAEERFESLNREVVNQRLSGVKVICEKLTRTSEGRYKTYLAIELSATDLIATYNERLSKDDRLKIDYDYEKFKQTFEEEMRRGGIDN